MSVILGTTGITFPNGSTQTVAATASGTVSSIATGTGLTGGTITTTGTISLVTTYGAVGTYGFFYTSGTYGAGATAAGSALAWIGLQNTSYYNAYNCSSVPIAPVYATGLATSGTWQCMSYVNPAGGNGGTAAGVFVRIA